MILIFDKKFLVVENREVFQILTDLGNNWIVSLALFNPR